MVFQKATKRRSKLRLALSGPSGSGKTYTALIAATVMAKGGKVALVDTEHGSASLYADKFNFDVMDIEDDFHPKKFIAAIKEAEKADYAVVVLDGLSHEWNGPGGILALHDIAKKRPQYGGNSYAAWAEITPQHDKLVEAILQSGIHVIATMRSKQEYALEHDGEKKKTVVKKLGLAPVQRDGMEYEFSIWGEMTAENDLVISKTRCDLITGAVVPKPAADFFEKIMAWLEEGEEPVPRTEKPVEAKADEDKPMTVTAKRKLQTIYTQVFEDELSIPPELTTGEGRKVYQVCLDCEHCKIAKDEAIKAIASIFGAAITRAA